MVTINKQSVAEWILLSYLAEQKYYKEKIRLLEKKYSSSFTIFEKELNTLEKESFGKWDDYIDWKAYQNLFINISKMIDDVRLGNFKVA